MGRRTYEVARKLGTASYPGVKNIVFSRTLRRSPDPAVTLDSTDSVRRQVDLDLVDSKVLKNGCVYLLYRVKRRRADPKSSSK